MPAASTSTLPPPDPHRPGAVAPRPGAVRRPAVRLLLVILVLLAAEGAARLATNDLPAALRHYDHTAEHRVAQMAATGHVDVVFVGSSMAWQAFDPATFSAADPRARSAFNAGLNGAVPTVTSPWLLDEVVPRLTPETVVWGLSTLDFAPAYGDEQERAYESSPAGRPGPLGVVERAAASVSALVRERAVLRRPGIDVTDELRAGRRTAALQTGPAGTRKVPGEGRDATQQAIQRARLADFDIDVDDLAALIATTRDLQARGVRVVLAELPLPPTTVGLHPGGAADVALARAAMTTVARRLAVPLVPDPGGFDDDDFADLTHLDAEAAIAYTTHVADVVGDVTRRTDPTPARSVIGYLDADADEALEDLLRRGLVDQIGCGGESLPADLVAAASPAGRIADPDLAAAIELLIERTAVVSSSCDAEAQWRMAMIATIEAQGQVILRLRDLLDAQELPLVVELADAASRSSEDLAVAALHGTERLLWLLRGAGNPRLFRHDVWWSFAQRGNVHRVLDAAETGAVPDLVVFGTSQARTGIDAELLGELLDADVLNLGIDGATIDAVEVIIDEVLLPHLAVDRAVLVVSGLDFLTPLPDRCPDDRLRGIADSIALAQEAFTRVPWFDGDRALALAADPGEDLPVGLRSPLVAAFEPAPDVDFPDLAEADIPRFAEPYVIAYRRDLPCVDRFAALTRSIESLRAAGTEVTVMTHPVRTLLTDAAPEGAVARLDARIRDTATAAGARVIPASGVVDDRSMVDAVHVSAEGARVLTTHLADELRRQAALAGTRSTSRTGVGASGDAP